MFTAESVIDFRGLLVVGGASPAILVVDVVTVGGRGMAEAATERFFVPTWPTLPAFTPIPVSPMPTFPVIDATNDFQRKGSTEPLRNCSCS